MSSSGLPQIEKLKGRDNYNSWKFAMKAYLEHEDLYDCITGANTDTRKDTRARAKIILSIDPINYVHVQETKTSKQAWDQLQSAFEDSGLTRKVGLLRSLVTTQLDSCSSVEEYVNKIVTTAHRLNSLKFEVKDEWIGTLLLAGLPDEYRPMIMGLESSGVSITADSIKTKLLQDIKTSGKAGRSAEDGESAALFFRGHRHKSQHKGPRCYSCNKYGHFANNCKNKKMDAPDRHSNVKGKKAFCALYSSSTLQEASWYIDSCASSHITSREDWLVKKSENTNAKIKTANNAEMSASSIGNLNLQVTVQNRIEKIEVQDVLFVPGAAVNLLSVSKIIQKGHVVTFAPEGCEIRDSDGTILATASEENGIFKLNTQEERVCCASMKNNANLWHRRLGHLNRKNMMSLQKFVTGYQLENCSEEPCETCIQGKHQRQPFKSSRNREAGILDLIHSDICGPMENVSIGGSRYFLTLIDDHSRKFFVYFLEKKSQVKETFEEFKTMVENQTGRCIKVIRTDNGKEYVNREFEVFLKKSGIRHQTTTPYSPQQNGLAERANRTIVEKARSMLIDADLDKSYWAEAVSTAVYLINRSPTKELLKMTPEEAWSGKKPNLQHLKVFGCPAMVHIPKEKRQKWDRKSEKYIFVGYCENTKGYRLINPNSQRIIFSRDVIFLENRNTKDIRANPTNIQKKDVFQPVLTEVAHEDKINGEAAQGDGAECEENDENSANTSQNFEESCSSSNSPEKSDNENEHKINSVNSNLSMTEFVRNDNPNENIPRRSSRISKPTVMEDFITFITADCREADPKSVAEAVSRHDRKFWIDAMKAEQKSLLENETWDLVYPPEEKNILDTKWVFKIKRNSAGDIERYKARLVVRGFSQVEGIDYNETYSPVVRYSSIRFLLALAVKYDLIIHQMDVVTAYLHGNLEEEIFVRQPEEFIEAGNEKKVMRLKKSMYGLKQSGREWNKKLSKTLESIGFSQSYADRCIYYRKSKNKILILAVFVDDILLLSSSENLMQTTKKALAENFKMKDLGEAKCFLGLNIFRNEKGIQVDQSTYIQEVLKRFNMADCKPVSTPLDPNQKLMEITENSDVLEVPYREAIGSLLHLCQGTRPDLSYAVGLLSRFSQNPKKIHWIAVKRVLRYLKGTENMKLSFCRDENSKLECYSDADWGNEIHGRKSISGYITKFQGGAVSWSSKKQGTIALSTTEAEYMALSAACQEVLWLRQLCHELDTKLVEGNPTTLFCDNKGAIDLADVSGYRPKTKHIDIRHHFLREHCNNKNITITYVPTEKMVADVLTKALTREKNGYCVKQMGLGS